MKKQHRKKMVAPILITVIVIAYYAVYFGVLWSIVPYNLLKLLLGLIPLIGSVAMIYVCIQRIKEIRSGEEDDLSKY